VVDIWVSSSLLVIIFIDSNTSIDLNIRSLFSRTGTHGVFDLLPHEGGFSLVFCDREHPEKIGQYADSPVMCNLYRMLELFWLCFTLLD